MAADSWNGPSRSGSTISRGALGYAGRRLERDDVDRWGKWRFPPGYPKGQLLYGWWRACPHLRHGLIVVEGAWSVMKLWQAGLPNVVALSGTTATAQQRSLRKRAARVVLFLDGDMTGRAATKRLAALHQVLDVVDCPAGQDPADLPEAHLRGLILARVPAWHQLFPARERPKTAHTATNPLQERIATESGPSFPCSHPGSHTREHSLDTPRLRDETPPGQAAA